MDSQLEICWGGYVFEQGILHSSIDWACERFGAFLDYQVVETCRKANHGIGAKCAKMGGTTREDAACCFNSSLAKLHFNAHPHS